MITISKNLVDETQAKANTRMQYGFRGPVKDNDYKFTMLFIACIGELAFRNI